MWPDPNLCRDITVYQETLTKGKFDEFIKSWLNRQTIKPFNINILSF